MFILKEYQQRALDALSEYFKECSSTGDADTAFYSVTKNVHGTGIPYNVNSDLPNIPYVCLRIPTGGGKTVVACHSISIAMKDLLQSDISVVLWLVPSNAIREQTLARLKNLRDPYRQAIDSSVSGSVSIMNIDEAYSLSRGDVDGGTVVIVSTMQAFRRDDTEGLRVYRDSGSLMDHFTNIPSKAFDNVEKYENGKPYRSLANVLCLRRPIVIVDEAHNARSDLSFETLKRFDPSCVIEFTATPDRDTNPSNIIHSVSAAELKAESVIKMPIRLETRSDWKELLADAISCRKNLEDIAVIEQQQTSEYIRPVMLIQAQPKKQGQEVICEEVVKNCLINDCQIPEEQIAIRTGVNNEIDGIDLSDSCCPIRFVITVRALQEGWDCPNAYVLCSFAKMASGTAVEQMLGRVMRLPRVTRKNHEELNMAYAFVASQHFYEAANALTDALVQSGFERKEAKDFIITSPNTEQATLPYAELIDDNTIVDMPKPPKKTGLPKTVKDKFTYDKTEKRFTYKGEMTKEEKHLLKEACPDEDTKNIIEKIYRISNNLPLEPNLTPSEEGKAFEVPFLSIKQGDIFEAFEETHFLEQPWSLKECNAAISESEYSSERRGSQHGEIDEVDGSFKIKHIENIQEQMALFTADLEWSTADLIHWLCMNIPHRDLIPEEVRLFFVSCIQTLMRDRNIPLSQLCHDKYKLKLALKDKLAFYRNEARKKQYQSILSLDCETPLVVNPNVCFSFDSINYPAGYSYKGNYKWNKHYYPEVGDLKSTGEEFECAEYIDQLEDVEYWVRNLERRPNQSFWLQTATDRFYPDFVCKLKDGRILVIEYKGAHLYSTKDSEEKRILGELWAKLSNGKCLFVMPTDRDFDSINRVITGN